MTREVVLHFPMSSESQSVFRLAGFRTIWIAQFVSIFGDFLALFGIIIFIASPLVAGALVAWLSEKAAFYLDGASFFLSALLISTLVIERPPRENADKTLAGLARDFAEGNRFIFTHPGLSFVFLAMAA